MNPATSTINSMSNRSTPLVSIGLPVYNGEAYLCDAINSLLAQTFSDFELIISDNASTDRTEEICRDYAERDSRICYFRSEENHGAAWNFNNAFELAHGKYFKWVAHDDRHEPEFIAKCVAILEQNSSIVLCFTGTDFIDSEGRSLGEDKFPVDVSTASRRELFRFFATSGHIVHEIFGIIRSDALRHSPLIGSYVGSDLVLLGTLALQGHFHQIHELLFLHREHAQRSAIVTGGSEGFTQWYDSSKSGKFAMPYWRRIFENMKSVARAPIGVQEKLLCWLDICRAANWNRRALWEDIVQVIRRNKP
jgi:glycosyltransferase involved in cell wall biosynthesis